MNNKLVSVAIDGYSKCGKSTLAKKIAAKYDFLYIDSGALYRFITFLSKDMTIDQLESFSLINKIDQKSNGNIIFNSKEYGDNELGSIYVNENVSKIAQNPIIRKNVNNWILYKSSSCSVVMDGRDIGTEVLPYAQVKVFLYASVDYRMKQWEKIQISKYGKIDPNLRDQERKNIILRDRDDETRKISPIRCAPNATKIDVEKKSFNKIFEYLCIRINEFF